MSESLEEITKSNALALTAIAEVLHKLDNRIEAAESADMEAREAAEEDEMRKAEGDRLSNMIKSALQEALPEIIKTVSMELNGDSDKKVDGGTAVAL